MNSVSVQIKGGINDAISNQILPLFQNAFEDGTFQLRDRNMITKIAEMTE